MTSWTKYTTDNPEVKLTDLTSIYIVEALGQILTDFFSYKAKKRPLRTTLVKDTLTELGDKELTGKPSYKVYSHGLSIHLRQSNGGKYKNTEWLYDLHWYTESSEPYLPKSLPLVVECEWNPKRKGDREVPYSGIKYDFQKLLVTNADLRLMIFIIKKDNEIVELDKYFNKAINNYIHLVPGSKFLFIAFDERLEGFHYTYKQK
jgi:hypothetical protein